MMNLATGGRIARQTIAAFSLAIVTTATAAIGFGGGAEAKTPGSTYCFNGICHRVKTIAETRSVVGRRETQITSYYDDCSRDPYNPCGLTSSGERFHAGRADNAASPIYPDGTTLLVRNPANGASAIVRVNNAGPYHSNRKLDLSRAAADKLGFRKRGIAKLEVSVMSAPTAQEARYVKERRYHPVPGFVGQYASLDDAQRGTAVKLALQASATSVLAPAAASMLTAMRTETGTPVTPPKTKKVAAARQAAPVKPGKTSSLSVKGATPAKGLALAAAGTRLPPLKLLRVASAAR